MQPSPNVGGKPRRKAAKGQSPELSGARHCHTFAFFRRLRSRMLDLKG